MAQVPGEEPAQLPELLDGIAAGQTIYVTEGEKDALAIVAAGGVATCNSGGAGKWRAEYNAHFVGADVVVAADKDEPGRRHAAAVAAHPSGSRHLARVLPTRLDSDG